MLADTVAKCKVGAATRQVAPLLRRVLGLPSILLASSSMQFLAPTQQSSQHRSCGSLQAELRKEGGSAFGSQMDAGAQTPAGVKLSQAMAKEALMVRHAHDQPCLAPCADGDIPYDVKTLDCSNNRPFQIFTAYPAVLMAFGCLLRPKDVQSITHGSCQNPFSFVS